MQCVRVFFSTRYIYSCSCPFKHSSPHTLRLARTPKYARRSIARRSRVDQFSIVQHPLTTESAMKKIEENNTLVFIVAKRANKPQVCTRTTRDIIGSLAEKGFEKGFEHRISQRGSVPIYFHRLSGEIDTSLGLKRLPLTLTLLSLLCPRRLSRL